MKVLLLLAIIALAHCDWQDGYILGRLWHSYRDTEDYEMISLTPDDIASQYGEVTVTVGQPFVKFDSSFSLTPDDLKRQNRGRRWNVEIDGTFYPKVGSFGGAGSDFYAQDSNFCVACFDVKKEDAELKEGHKGIGACLQYKLSTSWSYYDQDLFGTIEAQGSDSFRFAENSKNDWDTDAGYLQRQSDLSFDAIDDNSDLITDRFEM